MLAMVVNDNAGLLDERGALESIASVLAPTGIFSVVVVIAIAVATVIAIIAASIITTTIILMVFSLVIVPSLVVTTSMVMVVIAAIPFPVIPVRATAAQQDGAGNGHDQGYCAIHMNVLSVGGMEWLRPPELSFGY